MGQYQFESYVCRVDGAMNPHGIPIPGEISDPLWEAGLKRLVVKINGYEVRRGLQGSKENGSHIVVGMGLLKEAGVGTKDIVRVEIAPDPNPEEIEIPDELLLALEQDDSANDRWMSLAPGRKRSIAYHVSSAKRDDTRIKRALDIANKRVSNNSQSNLHMGKYAPDYYIVGRLAEATFIPIGRSTTCPTA